MYGVKVGDQYTVTATNACGAQVLHESFEDWGAAKGCAVRTLRNLGYTSVVRITHRDGSVAEEHAWYLPESHLTTAAFANR